MTRERKGSGSHPGTTHAALSYEPYAWFSHTWCVNELWPRHSEMTPWVSDQVELGPEAHVGSTQHLSVQPYKYLFRKTPFSLWPFPRNTHEADAIHLAVLSSLNWKECFVSGLAGKSGTWSLCTAAQYLEANKRCDLLVASIIEFWRPEAE